MNSLLSVATPRLGRRAAAVLLSSALAVGGAVAVTVTSAASALPPGQSCTSYALSAPAAGREIVVAKDGSGHYSTINAAAQVAVAGDVVTIKSGTYNESVRVAGAGTSSRPIVFQAQSCGTVTLTGAGSWVQGGAFAGDTAPQSGNPFVTLKGLNFVDFATAVTAYHQAGAVNLTQGWRLEDVYMRNAGGWASVNIRGHDAVVDQTTIESAPYNALFAVGACCVDASYGAPGQLKRVHITNTRLAGNNTGRNAPTWEAVTKFMHTDDLLVDNLESTGNYGAGLWLDWRNYRYTVRNSSFHDNTGVNNPWEGMGLELEIYSDDGVVEGNRFWANSGPDILVSSSSRIEIRYNSFQGSSTDPSPQIEFHRGNADPDCGRPAPTGVYVHHNQFFDWGGQWGWAAMQTTTDAARSFTCAQAPSPVQAGHLFDANTYRQAAHSGPLVGWEGTDAHTVDAMRTLWDFEQGTSPATTTTTVAPTTTTTVAPTTTTTVPPTPSTTVPPPAPTADTSPPQVTVASPLGGSWIGKSAKIAASAADNRAVTRMQVYIDGVLRTTSSTGTVTYTWNANHAARGAHVIAVRAYDAAGNVGTSNVTVYR
jgi:hypothetical protein